MNMHNNKQRIRILDIFRGFAIIGTLGTNIWIFAHLGDLNVVFPDQSKIWWSSLDSIIATVTLFFVNGKFLGLLAIMFGVGLELKYQQSLRKGNAWIGNYIMISLILMIEGFLHYTLIAEIDILMSYALTAIIVAFIVKSGEKAIKRAMYIFGGVHILLFLGLLLLQFSGVQMSVGDMREVTTLYQDGTWVEQITYRLQNFVALRLEIIIAFSSNIFLFLIGVLLMRKGAFATDETGNKIRSKMLKYGLLVGIPLNMLVFVPGGLFDMTARYVFAPILSIGYMGLIAYMVEKKTQFTLWGLLEKIGKMSLSCYVLQNIICIIIFYGWGFSLGGKVNSISIIAIWIVISIIQIFFATLWLRFYPLGPMETARKAVAKLIIHQKVSKR